MKAFWSKYGNMLTWVLIVALAAFSGYTYWNNSKRTGAAEAAAMFEQLNAGVTEKNNVKVQRIAGEIETRHKDSIYAQMAALAAARSAFDAADTKVAKAQLQWAADHGNEEYKSVAKLRLAGVLLDEKAYDEALKVLATPFLPQFAGDVADRKGDVLVAQNKVAEARAAYQAALAAMDKNNPGRPLVELKLEAIGGVVAPAKAAA